MELKKIKLTSVKFGVSIDDIIMEEFINFTAEEYIPWHPIK